MSVKRVARSVRDAATNEGKSSTVSILQHPLHPMVVNFPIAFLSGALATDLAYLVTGSAVWAQFSFWLCAGGLTMGLLAALLGMTDFFTMHEARRHVSGWSHFISGIMLLSLAAANTRHRWGDVEDVWPWGLLLSAVGTFVVGVTGWLGGTLTFRHDIGTYGDEFKGEDSIGDDDDDSDSPPKD
ncbi:DUF2231 domain-containing protein [Coralloluteibacterium thermophilus]|uniref:DUF2231 domain-containing protein n=1 Tax=Coralloluteibacterium thermophilum TaxID=2707049 RepID=A0ABV9NP68_9GAMM